MEEKKKLALRTGASIIILLLFLTVAEYLIGSFVMIWWGAAALIGIALIKAYYVVREYMHVSRLFTSDEEVH
jgi:hypothetical protein